MEQSNPYSAPQSRLDAEPISEIVQGGRGERLGAAIIDGLIVAAVFWGLMFVLGGTKYLNMVGTGDISILQWMLGTMLAGFGVFIAIQGYPLAATGQTWGKKMLNLRIVDMQGYKPEFVKLIAMRYLLGRVLGLIPLYGIIDVLFIFGEDRRCVHDYIAGTRVVVAK